MQPDMQPIATERSTSMREIAVVKFVRWSTNRSSKNRCITLLIWHANRSQRYYSYGHLRSDAFPRRLGRYIYLSGISAQIFLDPHCVIRLWLIQHKFDTLHFNSNTDLLKASTLSHSHASNVLSVNLSLHLFNKIMNGAHWWRLT